MSVDESELRAEVLAWRENAKAWFAQEGREVAIVVPSFRDSHLLKPLFAGLTAVTPAGKYRVVVTDDASDDAGHTAYLTKLETELLSLTVLRNRQNGGFASNVNRALRTLPDDIDVVLMNSDVVPFDGWLAALQYSLHLEPADLIAPKLLYPDGTIQFCGGMRHAQHSTSFDHRLRFRAEYFPAATVRIPTLYATGAVLYIPAATRARLGPLDTGYTWAHDDVDYAVQCWAGGGRVAIEPRAVLMHHENATIGRASPDPRIAASHRWFWEKNGAFFDRKVRASDGRLRVILVTHEIGAQLDLSSLRDTIEALSADGFSCEIWNLGGAVHFLDRDIASRGFTDAGRLAEALAVEDALKICADWQVAQTVWLGSVQRGMPVYWARRTVAGRDAVEDAQIQASYLPEFSIIAPDQPSAGAISAAGYTASVIVADDSALLGALKEIAAKPDFGFRQPQPA
ncbi:MAG: glycosyltransferase [Devosia sp.]